MKVADIPAVHTALLQDFHENPAPVRDFIEVQGHDPFKVLVATILSARTKDELTTVIVRDQLFPEVPDLDALRRTPRERIEQLIYPVGFYRQKARFLHELPAALDTLFEGRIPDTVEELCQLPGVGRKTANLVVAQAFGKPAICVDVHVHRICNRLGLMKTRNPLETEKKLRQILPIEYWIDWNGSLVSFGQRRCTPQRPKCEGCPVRQWCSRVGVK